jgi:hypothetical protein
VLVHSLVALLLLLLLWLLISSSSFCKISAQQPLIDR